MKNPRSGSDPGFRASGGLRAVCARDGPWGRPEGTLCGVRSLRSRWDVAGSRWARRIPPVTPARPRGAVTQEAPPPSRSSYRASWERPRPPLAPPLDCPQPPPQGRRRSRPRDPSCSDATLCGRASSPTESQEFRLLRGIVSRQTKAGCAGDDN